MASTHTTWLYYGIEFPLVRVRNRQPDMAWWPHIKRSSGFAVGDDYVLFQGSDYDSDTYHLLRLRDQGTTETLAHLRFVDPKRGPILAAQPHGRGDALWLRRGTSVYRVTIADALAMMYT